MTLMLNNLITLLPEQFIIYLTRHATPDRSRNDLPYHLVPGPDLSERGLQEATELGAFFQRAGVRLVYASPLERTWRTATIAGQAVGLFPERSDDLHEWRPEETEKLILERMTRILQHSAEQSVMLGPVALVTHGGPVHALLKALGVPNERIERHRIYDSRNPVPPAGAWRVERVDGELNVRLVFAPQGVQIPAEAAG